MSAGFNVLVVVPSDAAAVPYLGTVPDRRDFYGQSLRNDVDVPAPLFWLPEPPAGPLTDAQTEVVTWATDTTNKALLVNGAAGCGKTTAALAIPGRRRVVTINRLLKTNVFSKSAVPRLRLVENTALDTAGWMVDAVDLLIFDGVDDIPRDALEAACRRFRVVTGVDKPFGRARVLLIGDLVTPRELVPDADRVVFPETSLRVRPEDWGFSELVFSLRRLAQTQADLTPVAVGMIDHVLHGTGDRLTSSDSVSRTYLSRHKEKVAASNVEIGIKVLDEPVLLHPSGREMPASPRDVIHRETCVVGDGSPVVFLHAARALSSGRAVVAGPVAVSSDREIPAQTRGVLLGFGTRSNPVPSPPDGLPKKEAFGTEFPYADPKCKNTVAVVQLSDASVVVIAPGQAELPSDTAKSPFSLAARKPWVWPFTAAYALEFGDIANQTAPQTLHPEELHADDASSTGSLDSEAAPAVARRLPNPIPRHALVADMSFRSKTMATVVYKALGALRSHLGVIATGLTSERLEFVARGGDEDEHKTSDTDRARPETAASQRHARQDEQDCGPEERPAKKRRM